MKLLINVIGHNASGKTTVAKKLSADLDINYINGDDFRVFLSENVPYFKDLDYSYPNPIARIATKLTYEYRIAITAALLDAGESLIIDGFTNKEDRQKRFLKFKANHPDIFIVYVWLDLPEDELLERLSARDRQNPKSNWVNHYLDFRKAALQKPTEDECDLLLVYNQDNYNNILENIANL